MNEIIIHPKNVLLDMEYEDINNLEDRLFDYYLLVKSIRNMKHCLKTIDLNNPRKR